MSIICPYFGRCGGCKYQNLSEKEYLQRKRNFVLNALNRQNIRTIVSEIIQVGIHTRRRITLACKNGKVGFNEAKSHAIISITECPILTPELEKLLPPIQELCHAHSLNADITILMTDWGADINIKQEKETNKRYTKKKVKALSQDILFLEAISSFCQQNKVARFVFDEDILFQICQLPFPSNVFMQPSIEGENILIQLVLEGAKNANNVLDLFCGLGTFTKPLAQNGKKVLGIDITSKSIEALKKHNIPAEERDLFRHPLQANELNEYDCVVLDPARAGAKAQCEELAKSKVQKIIMVSCNPITFARDCKILIDAGYKTEKIIPVDQFIYSEHLELVAYLSKN